LVISPLHDWTLQRYNNYYNIERKMGKTMKKIIITALLALVTLAGQAQIKCHIEG